MTYFKSRASSRQCRASLVSAKTCFSSRDSYQRLAFRYNNTEVSLAVHKEICLSVHGGGGWPLAHAGRMAVGQACPTAIDLALAVQTGPIISLSVNTRAFNRLAALVNNYECTHRYVCAITKERESSTKLSSAKALFDTPTQDTKD